MADNKVLILGGVIGELIAADKVFKFYRVI